MQIKVNQQFQHIPGSSLVPTAYTTGAQADVTKIQRV